MKCSFRKTLIGLVPCAADRHTATQIVSLTQEALSDIGLTYKALTIHEQEGQDAADSTEVDSDCPILTAKDLAVLGVNSSGATNCDHLVFKEVSDNGTNIKVAWTTDSNEFTL